jgi:hypothetical protein
MIIKPARISTPVERATLNLASPLSRGVRLAWSFGANANLLDAAGSGTMLQRAHGASAASPIITGGPSGAGLRMTDSGSADGHSLGYLTATKTAYITNSFGAFGAAAFFLNSKSLNARNLLLSITDSSLLGVYIDFTSDPAIRAITGTTYTTATYTVPTNKDICIGVSWGSGAQIYVDGRLVGTGGVGFVNTSGATVLDIGARRDFSNDYGLNAVMYAAVVWDRAISAAEHAAFAARPFELFAPLHRRIYFDLGGGATAKAVTLSLEAAVQVSRSATAGIDAGVQRGLSATASIEAAISRALTATASLESAIRAALTATTSVDSYVQAGSTATASLDAAISRALSATASLDSGIQLARNASATIDSAIQRALSATASLDGYVQAGTTVSASLDAAIRYARAASASLDSAISLARTATASMDADIVVAAAGTVTASLDAALAATSTAVSALDSAVRWARAATATMDGYIYDSAAVEAEGYTFKATARPSFRATRRVVQ